MRYQPNQSRGWSLVEVTIVLVITTLLAEPAARHLTSQLHWWRMGNTAAQLHTDIALARSLATTEGQSATVTFNRSSEGACYVVHVGPKQACTCTPNGAATCEDGTGDLRAVRHLPASSGVKLLANVPRFSIDPTHGTATPTATLRLSSDVGDEQRVIVNITGRTRACIVGQSRMGLTSC